ncbi:hypothetical protein [Salipaludibacillus daqingensis]|uniref:hypothetical protein n=1 Tax=Salipaludibacillus daqingensis TaxID=3041001 RepID=UPI00247635D0|nr:hypothetical protein [Salipaludibacillus daqingensis]
MNNKDGVIKKILLDHISNFWELHDHRFPEEYRENIYETVYSNQVGAIHRKKKE